MAEEKLFRGPWWQYPPLVAAIVAGIISGAAFVLAHTNLLPPGVEKALYLLAIIIGGLHWMREGLERLLSQGRIDIKILMIGATGGSVALNLWDEAAFLVFLYGAAEGLEEYTYARTRSSIRDLLDLAPKQAVVLRGEREISVPAEEVRQGDVFLVRPGQSLVTDGVILEGESYLDESTVTGESTPVKKGPGDKVFAGTINQTGALKVRATASFEDNTLSRIIHLIEEAQRQKSRTQLFIERFGIWYSPLVLFTSAALAIGALFFSPDPLPWLKRAVVLLVAGAPCALVMSTPIAIAAGIGRAGREGVLIKGGVHLENLGKIKVVAFDKTGTLTLGRPMVTDIVALTEEEELLRLALTLERLSEHPLARAIVAAAEERGLTPLKAEAFKALAGSGVKATVAGKTIYLGRPELMDDLGVDLSHLQEQLSSLRAQGKTIVVVAEEKKPLGLLALRDKVRPKAKEVIRELHHLGIESVMLTGDHLKAARPIAQELGIDEVRAGLSPEDKIRAVEELKRHRGPVAMVGDGVNDAPALAQATVGIAMGAAGTDAAIEAADVALMGDDLGKIVFALKLGRRAREISRENIIFSLLVLMVLIPLALLGAISAAWAVLCHEASELLAVANGLRTSRLKEA